MMLICLEFVYEFEEKWRRRF